MISVSGGSDIALVRDGLEHRATTSEHEVTLEDGRGSHALSDEREERRERREQSETGYITSNVTRNDTRNDCTGNDHTGCGDTSYTSAQLR